MLNTFGDIKAPIVVIVDPPPYKTMKYGLVMSEYEADHFSVIAEEQALDVNHCYFVSAAPTIPKDVMKSDPKTMQYLSEYREELQEILNYLTPKVVICMGKYAANQYRSATKAIAIEKKFGIVNTDVSFSDTDSDVPYLYAPDPYKVSTRHNYQIQLGMVLREAREIVTGKSRKVKVVTHWCSDIDEVVSEKLKLISVDTETTGLQVYRDNVYPFLFQFAISPTEAYAVPCHPEYAPHITRDHDKIKRQIQKLLTNKNIKKVGHNLQYDFHMFRKLGVKKVVNYGDTQILMWHYNENTNKSLDDLCRIYVPSHAGLNDYYNEIIDKSNIINEDPEVTKNYGGNDVCMTYAGYKFLEPIIKQDKWAYNIYQNVQLPGMYSFYNMFERTGVYLPSSNLDDLDDEIMREQNEILEQLIEVLPRGIKDEYATDLQDLQTWGKKKFLNDLFFEPIGLNIAPKIKTPTGKPSTNYKNHLHLFEEKYPVVKLYGEFQKYSSVKKSVIGNSKGTTGYRQYLYKDYIHPNYNLVGTVTGRASSSEPNGQNLIQHGPIAKQVKKKFVAPEDFVILKADYKQMELRVMAWASGDATMLDAYIMHEDADLHIDTAALFAGVTRDKFMQWPKDKRSKFRQNAKAGNFGLIYKISVDGYIEFALNNYKVSLTYEQAEEHFKLFFEQYPGVLNYQNLIIKFARKKKYVRSVLGHKKHLFDICSDNKTVASQEERNAVNNPVQGTGGLIAIAAANRMQDRIDREDIHDIVKPFQYIHDAFGLYVHKDHIPLGADVLYDGMVNIDFKKVFNVDCPVPLNIDMEIGYNFAEMEDYDYVPAN